MDANQFSAIIAAAIQQAMASGIVRTPEPGSAAGGGAASWAEKVAAGPPAPPPAPAATQVVIPQPDLLKAFNNFMGWKLSGNMEHPMVMEMLKSAYSQNPQFFEVRSGIHTTPDGGRTYFSVIYRNPFNKLLNCAMHFYGSVRATFFNIKTVEVYNYDRTYTILDRTDMDSTSGSE